MRTLTDHLTQYAAYHRDGRNVATHCIGIPLIVVGVNATWRPGPWILAANVRYNGAMTLSNLTVAPIVRQDAYVVSDLSAQYAFDARLTLYGAITNLFDAHYTDSSANSPSNIAQAAPRAFNVGARVRF